MILRISLLAAFTLLALLSQSAQAISYCASDGQPTPIVLIDRFISADCDSCWIDPKTPRTSRGELALDWVVPSPKGDEAPLSAVATRDALERLAALGLQAPAGEALMQTLSQRSPVSAAPKLRLRVAHGLPVNDYIGTSIEAKPASALKGRGEVTAWFVLVETVPAGTDGTPVQRNLVRNLLVSSWNGDSSLSKTEQKRFYESRPMHVAEGAKASRLRVIGWLQDAKGKVRTAAQSVCHSK